MEEKYVKRKKHLGSKESKANVNKTKAVKIGTKSLREITKTDVDPCGKRVMLNSIQCQKCEYWKHTRCLHIKGRLMSGMNYKCAKYKGKINNKEDEKHMKLKCDAIETVKDFYYLGAMLGKYDSTLARQ